MTCRHCPSLTSPPLHLAAHILVLLHMLPAFQLFAQPVYALVESWMAERNGRPSGGCCSGGAWASRLVAPLPLRLWWRSAYVLVMTFLAIMMPFFNDVSGSCKWCLQVLGALFTGAERGAAVALAFSR